MQLSGRGAAGLVVPLILLFVGFLVTSAVVEERRREEQLPSRAAELLTLIRTQEEGIGELSEEARALSTRLAELQRERGLESETLRESLDEVESLSLPASVAPAAGPGVVVEMSDSESAPQTRGELTDLRIQDVDLRLVVNALWQAGAEAIAVNGQRVGATSAIRAAGERILVNFSPVASPYRIEAIGDPERIESALGETDISRQFDIWTQVYGLGFSVRSTGEISVPGLEGGRGLQWARPAEDG